MEVWSQGEMEEEISVYEMRNFQEGRLSVDLGRPVSAYLDVFLRALVVAGLGHPPHSKDMILGSMK